MGALSLLPRAHPCRPARLPGARGGGAPVGTRLMLAALPAGAWPTAGRMRLRILAPGGRAAFLTALAYAGADDTYVPVKSSALRCHMLPGVVCSG